MENRRMAAAALHAGQPLDVGRNAAAVLLCIKEGRTAGAALLALPEMCLAGCTAGDLAAHPTVTDACERALQRIAAQTAGMAVVLGLPIRRAGCTYNAAALLEDGRLKALVLKRALSPAERRVFSPGEQADTAAFPCSVYAGAGRIELRDGTALCVRFYHEQPSAPAPVTALMRALPAVAGDGDARRLAACQAAGDGVLLWANAGLSESTTDLVFDGQAVIACKAGVLAESAPFADALALWDGVSAPAPLPAPSPFDRAMPYAPLGAEARARWCREAREICARALAVRLERIHAKGATLGLSGGLDSAMALLTALRAFEIAGLPKDSLFAVTLPAFGSGARTRGNAAALFAALGLQDRSIDLTGSVSLHLEDIGHPGNLHDAAFENAQARERTQVLMDKANSLGGLMIGTGDLSELALGFTTFGGDHLSMYGVNAGLYKTALRLIVADCAAETVSGALAAALRAILDTPISPELLPPSGQDMPQKTEDILGPYVLNDFFLHHLLSGFATPEDLLYKALDAFGGRFTRAEVLSRMRAFFVRFFASQFKRSCMPDGPMALGVSLSPRGGFDMPSDAPPALFLDAIGALTL